MCRPGLLVLYWLAEVISFGILSLKKEKKVNYFKTGVSVRFQHPLSIYRNPVTPCCITSHIWVKIWYQQRIDSFVLIVMDFHDFHIFWTVFHADLISGSHFFVCPTNSNMAITESRDVPVLTSICKVIILYWNLVPLIALSIFLLISTNCLPAIEKNGKISGCLGFWRQLLRRNGVFLDRLFYFLAWLDERLDPTNYIGKWSP